MDEERGGIRVVDRIVGIIKMDEEEWGRSRMNGEE